MQDVKAMPGVIEGFLADHAGQKVSVTGYEIMTGGYSRAMAKVALRYADGREETLVLRGDPPPEQALLYTDRDLEWLLLQAVNRLDGVPCPAARWYVDDPGPFGTKAIFIDYVDAPSLQSRFDGGLDPGSQVDGFVDLAASVALVTPEDLPPDLERPGDWDTYLSGLIDTWRQMERAYPDSQPVLRYIAAWLDSHRPPPMPLRLSHGDFQCANVLDGPDGYQLVDWEYAHIGDPREDLGWYNSYSAAAPPNLYMLDPERFLARYRDRTGFDETQVNQLTIAYFTVLSSVKVLSGLYQAQTAFTEGKAQGSMTTFNVLSCMFGNMNFLNAITAIDQALAAMGAAS